MVDYFVFPTVAQPGELRGLQSPSAKSRRKFNPNMDAFKRVLNLTPLAKSWLRACLPMVYFSRRKVR